MNSTVRFPLEDPLYKAGQAAAEMLQARDRNFSLPQPFYNDEQLFALDMQNIFEKEWLFAGMTCEIPKKGCFLTVNVGDNSVVVVRGEEDSIRAFHNVCRHRGSRLCSKASGKVAKLVCPYHQWTYELDGKLLFAGTDMGSDFDMSAYGLKPVHVRTHGGFIFICLADEPPALDDFGDALSEYVGPHGMDNVKVVAESDIIEKANWKLVIENNRECYHCNGAHPELLNSLYQFDDTEDPRATPEYKQVVERKQNDWESEGVPWRLQRFGQQNRITRTPLVEGTVSMTPDGQQGVGQLMGRLTSPDMGSLRILHLPNSWNHVMGDHAVVFRVIPIGPQETRVTTKWLVNADNQEGVDYDPETLRKVWDATNDQDRQLAEENQRGINSLAYEPGPYSETFEFGIIDFLDWYSQRMLSNLQGLEPELKLANAQ
ncbi:aromatic ring-hydroxylating dioxygenase subunit alpha [Salinisphaera sp. Q1T1-3]|uniref:aromatic ring-hydroxylating oxygenase subunit alpha n=1 Tax=Salinisphaera sp. Q1T1-3 TaxID=2321229 RepID=UPI000E768C6B|nr:aromatic ring-hydroxylating dioxygenase subunit alpha [Salinisphaera sp. Q1T1-3]RJS94410.1 aromatic ring-hydroxylating dioxygenase subunit alpha [Salinisphaera sp. Q1T1-3]